MDIASTARGFGKLAIVGALLATGGCVHSPVAIAASTRPLEQGRYTEIGEVAETDCAWHLLGFIPISGGNETQGAIKDAIEDAGGGADSIIQVSVDTFYHNYLIISRYCTEVKGIAVKSHPIASK